MFILSQLLGFINYSLNLRTYGFEVLGFFLLISAVFGIGSTLDFGFGISTVKIISECNKKKDYAQLNAMYNSFLVLYLILALVISCGFAIYYIVFLKNVNLPAVIIDVNFAAVYALLIASFFFGYIGAFFRNVFEGFAEYVLLSKISFCLSTVTTLLMLFIYVYRLQIQYLAFFSVVSSLLSCIVLFVFIKFRVKLLTLRFKSIDFRMVKNVSGYSLNIQAASFIGSFVDPLMKYITGTMLGYNYVAVFETGKKIVNLSGALYVSAQKGLLNKLSEINAEGKLKEFVNNGLNLYSKIADQYSLVIYGVLNPLICLFILYWFNSFESIIVSLIFMLSYALINFAVPPYLVLMIEGRGLRLPLIQLINVVLTTIFLLLSLKLLGNYLGFLGYYMATILNVWLINYFMRRSYNFEFKNYIVHTYFQKIIILSILATVQLTMLFLFSDLKYWILCTFFVVYLSLFYKHVFTFYNFFVDRLNVFRTNRDLI